jgi:phosphoribosylaminoimidazole (AIR) synthetase
VEHGIGFVLVVKCEDAGKSRTARATGHDAYRIGEIVAGSGRLAL